MGKGCTDVDGCQFALNSFVDTPPHKANQASPVEKKREFSLYTMWKRPVTYSCAQCL